jgi:hypothetical protein
MNPDVKLTVTRELKEELETLARQFTRNYAKSRDFLRKGLEGNQRRAGACSREAIYNKD